MKNVKFIFLSILILFLGNTMEGQVSQNLNPSYGYTFSNSAGTYTSLSGATVFQSGTTINTDGVSAAITLPFIFTFNGIKSKTIFISNNGFITFGLAPATGNYVPLSTTTSSGYDGAIAGSAMNCVASTAAGATPEISHGSAGSDYVVQFQDIGQSGFAAIRMTFQIVLKSDGKTIQLIYGPNNVGVASSGQCQVGLRGTNDEDWNNRTLSSGGNWNTAGGAAGTVNTSAMSLTSATTLPSSGRTFQWITTSYLPTYNTSPTTIQEFTTWANGSGPSNVPSSNWATNGYGNASWQIDNNPGTTATSGWGSVTSYLYSPVDYLAASGGHSARFHSGNANSPQVGYLDYYVDLSSLTGTPSLDFFHINTSGTDILQVYLSTDGGSTFNQLGSNITTSSVWTAKSLSLGSSNSATSIVRFKATSDYGSTDIGVDHLVITPPPALPTISSFSPGPDLCLNGGQTITITGTNYSGTTSVTFNGVNAASFSVVNSTSITAVTPSSLTSGAISVTNPAGTATSSSYNVVSNPTVSVSPATTSFCTGGSPITLTASGASTYTWSPATSLSATSGATVDASPSLTTTYVVTGTDANSCTNTASAVITVTNTPVAPTTTNYSLCIGGSIPSGQGLTSTSVGGNVITGSQTINFDVSSQPVETNSTPGNTVSSATMAALPAGSTVTSVVINYPGLVALSSSWRSDIKLGLSGEIVNSAAADPLAPGSAGTLNYSRTASTGITANNTGGTVNLLYWDSTNDNAGAEATFPTGTGVASLTINYSYPSPSAIAWYDASSGGNFIANGSPFNPIGVDPALPNSNVAGNYTYYAQVNNGSCSSTRSSAVLTIGSSPTATATAPQSTICIGSSTTLTANPVGSSPFTYLWNDPSASTTQAVSVSPTSNTTYMVTVTDACTTTTTASISIAVDAPNVGSPTATSVCGSGTSTLSTTGSVGTIKWYDAASNGNLVGTGTSVVSPVINSATTYYVDASNIGSQSTGLGSIGTPTPSNTLLSAERGIVVTITNSGILNSAQFYSASGAYAGTARLVNNSTGTQIASTSISGTAASAGMQTMNLNWELTAGTSYRLLLTLTSGSYSNNNSSVNYSTSPWNNFGTYGSITSGYDSGVSTTTYSNFYNMSYTPACITSRTAVTVPYSVPPTIGTVTGTPASICAGSSSSLNLSGVDPTYTTFTWSNGGSGLPLSVSPSITTTYTVTATDGTCATSTSITVTVNPIPSSVTITQGSSVSKCASQPSVQLDATGGTIGGIATIGTGTTVNSSTAYPSPLTNYYGGTKHQMLIRASELTALGIPANASISSLTFNVYAVGSTFTGTLNNFQIDMVNTSSTVLTSSSFIGSLTNVRSAASLTVPTTSLPTNLTIPITPFVWNGTDNLLIQTSYSNVNSGTSTDYVQMQNTDPGFVSTNWYRADSQTAGSILSASTPTSSGNSRPNITVSYSISSDLIWSPTSGLFTDAGATVAYTGTAASTLYAAPGSTQTYTVTATTASGCTNAASVAVNVEGTVVTSSADSGPGTLRSVLGCVVDGGTVTYDQPTTNTTVLTGPLTIDKNVTIQGGATNPEITVPSSGITVSPAKILTLQNVDIKSTSPTQTFTGEVSITGTTVIKQ